MDFHFLITYLLFITLGGGGGGGGLTGLWSWDSINWNIYSNGSALGFYFWVHFISFTHDFFLLYFPSMKSFIVEQQILSMLRWGEGVAYCIEV